LRGFSVRTVQIDYDLAVNLRQPSRLYRQSCAVSSHARGGIPHMITKIEAARRSSMQTVGRATHASGTCGEEGTHPR
jgi:hypothetical protein